MKVAFIFPTGDAYSKDKPIRYASYINYGISYISAVLKSNGHTTRLFVLTPNNQHQIEVLLEEFGPGLICFTSVATTYHLIKNLAGKYKQKHPGTFLVAGGCHVSLNPEETIADSFDAICIGEGEYPTLELANQLEQGSSPSKIENLWIKSSTGIEKNATRHFIEKLDELPLPDRQMWKEWIWYPDRKPSILIGRGCPFQCTHCCNHKLARLSEGVYTRFRSSQNILDEIEEHLKEYPQAREIHFETETIGANLNYALDLCSALEQFNKKYPKLIYGVNVRVTPNLDHTTLFEALQRANFKYAFIGLESGSERVRREILNRKYSNDDVINAVNTAKRCGLEILMFIMVGIPGETPEDFQQTIEVARKCQPHSLQPSIFYPYPGTELARVCKEKRLIDESFNTGNLRERRQSVLNSSDFPQKQVLKSFIWLDYNVFKGYEPYPMTLIRLLQRKVVTSVFLERFFNWLLGIPILMALRDKVLGW